MKVRIKLTSVLTLLLLMGVAGCGTDDHVMIERLSSEEAIAERELVPVRLYHYADETGESFIFSHTEVHLSGANFVSEMIAAMDLDLDKQVMNMWFEGVSLYVDLDPEGATLSRGTFGERVWYKELLLTVTSIPYVDRVVILVDGERESAFGSHGLQFADFYLVNDPEILEWRVR